MLEERFETMYRLLWGLVRKINYLQSLNLDYGTGQVLTATEIHTIENIGKNPGIIVSDLAKLLVVSKGAVSQTISKLASKGLVRKYKMQGDNKQVHLGLTDQGALAFQGHADFHARFDTLIVEELKNMSQEEYEICEHMLRISNQNADHYIRSLIEKE